MSEKKDVEAALPPSYDASTSPPSNPDTPYTGQQPEAAVETPHENGSSIGAFLFVFGFCFPLFWFFGSCVTRPVTQSDRRWRAANQKMSLIAAAFLLATIILLRNVPLRSSRIPLL